mgnify:CR=1 FL=1
MYTKDESLNAKSQFMTDVIAFSLSRRATSGCFSNGPPSGRAGWRWSSAAAAPRKPTCCCWGRRWWAAGAPGARSWGGSGCWAATTQKNKKIIKTDQTHRQLAEIWLGLKTQVTYHLRREVKSTWQAAPRWTLKTHTKISNKNTNSYRRDRRLPLKVRQWRRVVRHIGEDQPLLVVVFAEYLVFAQVEAIADTESGTENVENDADYNVGKRESRGKTVGKSAFILTWCRRKSCDYKSDLTAVKWWY